PHTESDPTALLLTYLTSFGNAVGRGPHYVVEDTRHFANLFTLLAGNTAKARKGTSSDRIRAIFQLADPVWAIERVQGGMSSGEGVITAVRARYTPCTTAFRSLPIRASRTSACCCSSRSSPRCWRCSTAKAAS